MSPLVVRVVEFQSGVVMKKWLLCLLILLIGITPLQAEDSKVKIRHYQSQERYEFGIELLNLAMQKTGVDFEITSPVEEVITEARGELFVVNGALDLQFMSTTAERESSLIPIKIPVYRGLLGLRLLLVKPSVNAEIQHVSRLADLRLFVAGHGQHWGDLPVYGANDLKVVPVVSYPKIFEMLKKSRFDYFSRGVSEIWGELSHHQNDLVVADNIMLFYPHPVYFFVSKARPELAELLEGGLESAISDGSYRDLFDKHYRSVIKKANLKERNLVRLANPVVPEDTPKIDTSWWMPSNLLDK